MLDSDRERLIGLLRIHFTAASEGDLLLAWKDLRRFALNIAECAIEEHRRERGAAAWRPDLNRLKSLAWEKHSAKKREEAKHERIIDFCRKSYAADHAFYGLNDRAYLTLHFRRSWEAVQMNPTADAKSKQQVRALIMNHATTAFEELGDTNAIAIETARDVVDLEPGQKIAFDPLRSVAP